MYLKGNVSGSLCHVAGEHAFLADHKIGKRILIPATAYLVTAWEALAAQAGKPTTELPVEWSDVKVFQAVQAESDTSVTLSVLLDRSHRFQVSLPAPQLTLYVPQQSLNRRCYVLVASSLMAQALLV